MNIGIYNPRVGIADAGGTETFLRSILPHLAKTHSVTLYLGDGEIVDDIADMDVELRRILFSPKESSYTRWLTKFTPLLSAEIESLSMYFNARRTDQLAHMEREMDVVSTHYYSDNILISRAVDVPSLFHFPGLKSPSIRWKSMAKFAQTDSYVANSESTAKRARDWFGIDTDGVVYPGIDPQKFTPDNQPAFTDERFVILYVGRLDSGKGLPDLIKAHAQLSIDTALYIVGEGTLREQLESQVRELGTEDSVQFCGAVPHSQVPQYYVASDVFCLPSYHEGFGMVNIEAMACGTPVISTAIDAIEEYITDENNGLLVEPGDIAGIADAIERLKNNSDLREKLVTNALETSTEFTWAVQASKLERFYQKIARH